VSSDPDRLVRPYLITGGRTHPVDELHMEALVETLRADAEALGRLRYEPRRVADLCQSPTSIAEVAARLDVPLGVAKVLVADLASSGLLRIHRTVSNDGPDVPLLERLLDELRAC
jgi:hypothetical protein